MIDSLFPDEAKTQIELQTSLGYRSNVFETNRAVDPPVGDWFWTIQTEAAHPLAVAPNVSLTFQGGLLQYFRLTQLIDYSFQPGVAWQVFDEKDNKLEINAGGGAFRKRIFMQFQNVPDVSHPGLGGSAGWTFEHSLGDHNAIVWTGGLNYQHFNYLPQTNYTVLTGVKWVRGAGEANPLEVGFQWEGQHFNTRPEDSESAGNPAPLTTIEGRGFVRYSFELGAGFSAETSMNLGGNIDATNGYYDAWVVGAEAALRWQYGKWRLKVAAEPEFVWFPNRPANLGMKDKKLQTQEYAAEGTVEYRFTERVGLIGSCANHLQITNSKLNSTATLQSFTDMILSVKMSISY